MDERRLPCSDSVRSESITAEHVPDREPDERNQRIFSSCSYSGGIAPTEQRTETHGDHRVAAFKTTTLSAAGYVHNLNTHQARRTPMMHRTLPTAWFFVIASLTAPSYAAEPEFKGGLSRNRAPTIARRAGGRGILRPESRPRSGCRSSA